jgi:hypothetical protein
VLEQIVTAGGSVKSYDSAATLLKSLAEVEISVRHVGQLTQRIGHELAATEDARIEAYRQRPLPRVATRPGTPIDLASVACDGGRMQTRRAGGGCGVHDAHWRETKNAGFFRMKTRSHAVDPHPQLPRCFTSRQHLSGLLSGLSATADESPAAIPADATTEDDWRPVSLFRTCLAALEESEAFGWRMAAEADARGFFAAERRAFLGDGQAYNWTIQQTRFPTFEPILDFIHPLEYLYQAATGVQRDPEQSWPTFQRWTELVWQGEVAQVIDQLSTQLTQLAPDDERAREALTSAVTYLEHNRTRMDYPRYRREGLPVTSSLIESQIKEMNYRVKGSEKFWNDDRQGEAILFVRAALLGDDNRLETHLRNRPGSPFARPPALPLAAAA